jgi:DNA (cytosine-5)-methyltransferase 1
MKCIDLFAGWGGFSVGAEQAGADVVWAANHWPLAVKAHQLNHPRTHHECQDLRQADWSTLPDFDVLLAAPACQGHSQASQPKRRRYHDALRATAWAVVDCAEVTTPQALIVENVPDFRRWKLYPLWRQALTALGYHVSEHELTATDFGVPQRRKRLFVVGTRSKRFDFQPKPQREPAFGPCIDWDDGNWRPIARATGSARRRIEAARSQWTRCIVQHVTHHRGIPLSEPLRTVTCQDQWAVIDHDRYRPLTVRETARAMGFPEHYGWPEGVTRRDAITGLGNAVCPPVAAALVTAVAERVRCARAA